MILLDTHSLIFWINGDPILPQKRVDELERLGSEKVFLSSFSFWEIFIKVRKGKLNLGESSKKFTEKIISSQKLTVIDSNWNDFLLASTFSWKHSDPVDRILVAQAKNRGLKLLSKDSEIKKYYKETIWM
ncbi:MAG: type II toxin-antitoxin system VapC family toxin [Leptospira sp.]|nr:type II toxin-antitoxin system VapC family toxin [Leptospira sp.]MCZ8342654.1 type II toxin-antitoxin system VapC family toxin [Leptospira sp.]